MTSTFTVEVQLPEGLREIGCSDETIRREAPVLLVLKRFRQGELSSGDVSPRFSRFARKRGDSFFRPE